jgi:hypothetical protein
MALSHTFYVIKVFFYLKKEKNLNPLYFGLSHTSVSSDRQLRNAGLRSSLSFYSLVINLETACGETKIWIDVINLHLFLLFSICAVEVEGCGSRVELG